MRFKQKATKLNLTFPHLFKQSALIILSKLLKVFHYTFHRFHLERPRRSENIYSLLKYKKRGEGGKKNYGTKIATCWVFKPSSFLFRPPLVKDPFTPGI